MSGISEFLKRACVLSVVIFCLIPAAEPLAKLTEFVSDAACSSGTEVGNCLSSRDRFEHVTLHHRARAILHQVVESGY